MQPENRNFLFGHSYRLVLSRFPETTYFCQRANIPGVSVPAVNVSYPTSTVPFHGDRITFDPLNISFLVDEALKSWTNIFNWLQGVGAPKDRTQYAEALKNSSATLPDWMKQKFAENSLYSDATLTVYSNQFNPRFSITYKDVLPTSLGEIPFDVTKTDTDVILCAASFSYVYYEVNALT